MAARFQKMLLCVVGTARQEVSLSCAVSMLRAQTLLMTSAQPLEMEMHYVHSLNEALNALRADDRAVGTVILDAAVGFDPRFLTRSLASNLPLVVGTYALPRIDWDRVVRRPEGEPPELWGAVYNIKPGGTPEQGGYMEVSDAELGICWVRRDVLAAIEAARPELVSTDKTAAAFATEGVFDGQHRTAHRRFLDLYGGRVWADISSTGASSGPMEFVGCVGRRSVLR